MNTTESLLMKVPLGKEAHQAARQFAASQTTPQKGKRVYLNTLAVYAVNNYLQWLRIDTDLSQSSSWHPGLQSLFNVADLMLPGLGKLECRPVLPSETSCFVPWETTSDRIGYVAVQLNDALTQATLLGFVPTVEEQDLPLSKLKPLDELLEHLESLKPLTKLSLWFQGTIEAAWQAIDSLVNPPEPALVRGFRNTGGIRRTKAIDLGLYLDGYTVDLVVTAIPETEEKTTIKVQLHPRGEQPFLKPGVQLTLFDATGAIQLEAEARNHDNYLQMEFSGTPQERFSLRISLDDVSVTEQFEI